MFCDRPTRGTSLRASSSRTHRCRCGGYLSDHDRLADHHRRLAGVACHRDPACSAADGCAAIGLTQRRTVASHRHTTRMSASRASPRSSLPVSGLRRTVTQAHHLLTLNADDDRAHLVPHVAQGLQSFRKPTEAPSIGPALNISDWASRHRAAVIIDRHHRIARRPSQSARPRASLRASQGDRPAHSAWAAQRACGFKGGNKSRDPEIRGDLGVAPGYFVPKAYGWVQVECDQTNHNHGVRLLSAAASIGCQVLAASALAWPTPAPSSGGRTRSDLEQSGSDPAAGRRPGKSHQGP